MNLFEAIKAADLPQITTIVNNVSEHVTEKHLLAAINHPDVDKLHCKLLFDTFKTPGNQIPPNCVIAALEQSRIDIFLSLLRINHPDAPAETSTSKLQRAVSLRSLKPSDEAKYERHQASFIEMIQQVFSAEEKQQLHTILTIKDHPILTVLGEDNLGNLLSMVMPEEKHEDQKEHTDTMSTGTPPPTTLSPIIESPLAPSKQSSNSTLKSEDVALESASSDEFNAFLGHPTEEDIPTLPIKRQDSGTDTDESVKSVKSDKSDEVKALAIQEEARKSMKPHLDELQAALSAGLEQSSYEKIQEPMNKFMKLATDLALKADRTPEDLSLFRKQVKTEVMPEAQAALLEHESYFSFFCRKIMDALHALVNVLTPVFPSTKNSFFQTAPSRVAEQFDVSQEAITTTCGA
ncbi:MAG: hypothetical protein P1U39_01425 [Legionellaceae bacterium]|nr:hypothetical protein [Legionellaceae bacterium]